MAKRGGYPGGMGMPGNMNNLMKQAQRMQRQMEESQKELETKEFTAKAGGGAVEVTVTGAKEVTKVIIDKDAVDLFELNEAFAGQSIACEQLLKLDDHKVNPRGGAIVLGHPVGCSGARIVVTLVHEMQDLQKQTGIVSLCVGGGMGIAALLKLPN